MIGQMKKWWVLLLTSLVAILGGCELIASVDRSKIPNGTDVGGGADGGGGSGGSTQDGGGGIGGEGGSGGSEGGAGGSTGGTGGVGGVGGSGGSPCVPTTEVCDGVDNDCDPGTPDGSADPQLGISCNTGLVGICAAGTQTCNNGGLECTPDNQPTGEICNGLDDNCSGVPDEGNTCTQYTFTIEPDQAMPACFKWAVFNAQGTLLSGISATNDNNCEGSIGVSFPVFGGDHIYIWEDDQVTTVTTMAPISSHEAKPAGPQTVPNHAAMTTDYAAGNFSAVDVVVTPVGDTDTVLHNAAGIHAFDIGIAP